MVYPYSCFYPYHFIGKRSANAEPAAKPDPQLYTYPYYFGYPYYMMGK
jgi:hypothetical protein